MTVMINDDLALELLEDRLEIALNLWGNLDTKDLYVEMYENLIYSGCFYKDFNPMRIVDNDVVNYCKVIYKGDSDFKRLYKFAKRDDWDISGETFKDGRYSAIEAYNDDAILIRL